MTCLVAAHFDDYGTIVGSDTQFSSQGWKGFSEDGKWIFNDGWALGVAGEVKTYSILCEYPNDIIRCGMSPLDISNNIFKILEKNNYKFGDEEGFRSINSSFILANAFGICDIDPTGAVFSAKNNTMLAGGSGMCYALGAFSALQDRSIDPVEIVTSCIGAAIQYDPMCGGRIWMARVTASEKKISKRAKDVVK